MRSVWFRTIWLIAVLVVGIVGACEAMPNGVVTAAKAHCAQNVGLIYVKHPSNQKETEAMIFLDCKGGVIPSVVRVGVFNYPRFSISQYEKVSYNAWNVDRNPVKRNHLLDVDVSLDHGALIFTDINNLVANGYFCSWLYHVSNDAAKNDAGAMARVEFLSSQLRLVSSGPRACCVSEPSHRLF